MNGLVTILLLGLPVACVSWTITKEEVFRDIREWIGNLCQTTGRGCVLDFVLRKVAYLPTCYYCASHYVALTFLLLAGSTLADSYIAAWFALVWVANVYLTLFNLLRAWLRGVQAWADWRERVRWEEMYVESNGLAMRHRLEGYYHALVHDQPSQDSSDAPRTQ